MSQDEQTPTNLPNTSQQFTNGLDRARQPTDRSVVCLPNDEWGFLLKQVEHIHRELADASTSPGLSDERLDWVAERQVEANLLIDLIKGPEFRIAYLDWSDAIRSQLDVMSTE